MSWRPAVLVTTLLLGTGCIPARQQAWNHYTMAQEKAARAEWRDAEQLLRAAIEYDPTIPGTNVDLAIILLQSGKKEEALVLLAVEERLFPESHHFVELLRASIEEGKVVKPPVAPRNPPPEGEQEGEEEEKEQEQPQKEEQPS